MKHKLIIYVAPIQLIAALLLAASLYIRFLPFELITSYVPLFASLLLASLVAIIAAVLSIRELRNDRRLLAVNLAGLAVCVTVLWTAFTIQQPAGIAASKEPVVTFATFNKLYSNSDTARAADYFRQQNVDVISLQEAQPQEIIKLKRQLGFEYSFMSERISTARGTVVGLISRHPIRSNQMIKLTNGPALIRAEIRLPSNRDVAFYGVHLPGPFSPDLYRQRDANMVSVAQAIRGESLPAVLGGDFNTTIYSPSLREFNETIAVKARHTVTQRLPQCSWYGLREPLCARIDHVYIPKYASLIQTTLSPDIGSDHRAVIVRFSL